MDTSYFESLIVKQQILAVAETTKIHVIFRVAYPVQSIKKSWILESIKKKSFNNVYRSVGSYQNIIKKSVFHKRF